MVTAVQDKTGISEALWLAISQPHRFLYFNPGGYVIPGEEGITPAQLQQLSVGNAVLSALGTAGYPADDGSGPDPNGPLGPYIRDALIGLTVVRIAASIADAELSSQLVAMGAEVVNRQAIEMQHLVG